MAWPSKVREVEQRRGLGSGRLVKERVVGSAGQVGGVSQLPELLVGLLWGWGAACTWCPEAPLPLWRHQFSYHRFRPG